MLSLLTALRPLGQSLSIALEISFTWRGGGSACIGGRGGGGARYAPAGGALCGKSLNTLFCLVAGAALNGSGGGSLSGDLFGWHCGHALAIETELEEAQALRHI